MNIYCNNCGIKGHVYKDCKNPILSCGIILFKKEKEKYKLLMINRKDSLCYIDFIRGKYRLNNVSYIQILIDKMTIDEKRRLIEEEYDTLWKRLWLIDAIDKCKLKKDYKEGKQNFEDLKKGYYLKKKEKKITLTYLINRSKTKYNETEWEFPNGRRNKHETNRNCAIREFNEETNYKPSEYKLIQNIIPFSEEFNGENKVHYKYIYYIGYLLDYEKSCQIDPLNIEQKQEINNILWLSKEEALLKLRDYHHSRYKLINDIYRLVDNIKKDYFLS